MRAMKNATPSDPDRLSFAETALRLIEDGILQSRAPGLVLADLTAAALTRPTISDGIHRAIVETAERNGAKR